MFLDFWDKHGAVKNLLKNVERSSIWMDLKMIIEFANIFGDNFKYNMFENV